MSTIEIISNPFTNSPDGAIEMIPSGIQMKFNNGNTISIQWGEMSYSSTRFSRGTPERCTSAEICIWNEQNTCAIIDETEGTVKGWVEPDEVARMIFLASTRTCEEITQIRKKEIAMKS